MRTIDDTTLREWLDLDLDGALAPAEKTLLEEHLAARADLRAERRELCALQAMLAADRPAVREDFAAQVTGALRAAPWERSARSYLLPVALAAGFTIAAVLVLAGAPALTAESAVAGTAVALVDFLTTSTLAGAGLLAASWRGLGMGLEQLFAENQVNLVAFGTAVVFLNLLFFRMLRRRPAAVGRESDG